MHLSTALALTASTLAIVVFYLGCPNQQWAKNRPLTFVPASAYATALCVLAWWLFHRQFSTLASTFTLINIVMFGLGLLPFFSYLEESATRTGKRKSMLKKDARNGDAPSPQPQWRLKIATGLILGLPLALSVSGLLVWWGAGPVTFDTKSQLAMWLVIPLWLTPLALLFFSLTAQRILLIYCGLNLALYGLLTLAKSGT